MGRERAAQETETKKNSENTVEGKKQAGAALGVGDRGVAKPCFLDLRVTCEEPASLWPEPCTLGLLVPVPSRTGRGQSAESLCQWAPPL